MYEKQTQSKKLRDFEKMFGSFDSERLYTQLYKKNFKKTYAGKPTRKYLRLSNKIDMAERVPQINIISRFFKKH
jgi:hypothetical protein